MASAAKSLDPLLVSLKAVDPAQYPFYGTVDLEPAGTLTDALAGDTVAVADDLLVRLKLQVGDQLKLGNKIFRIAVSRRQRARPPLRLLRRRPARPHLARGLDATGLLAPGSRAGQRYLFKVPHACQRHTHLRRRRRRPESPPHQAAARSAGHRLPRDQPRPHRRASTRPPACSRS